MKRYGLILADNGSSWYISGMPDERWDNDMLVSEFRQLEGSDFEAVDVSSLMVDENSGEAGQVAYLTLARSGDGKGAFIAQGLSCIRNGMCSGTYNVGDEITITANPRTGSVLAEWNGCTYSSGNVCTIVMTGDISVTGTFSKRPRIAVSPRSINFGVLKQNLMFVSRVVTIRNKGSALLSIGSAEIAGSNPTEFELSNSCAMPLTHDTVCTITVTTKPASSGTKSADLMIQSNDEKRPSVRVRLRARVR
jgi:hypothetical protein